jgi:hypothetical protein
MIEVKWAVPPPQRPSHVPTREAVLEWDVAEPSVDADRHDETVNVA